MRLSECLVTIATMTVGVKKHSEAYWGLWWASIAPDRRSTWHGAYDPIAHATQIVTATQIDTTPHQ
jgi:hypothetical protein